MGSSPDCGEPFASYAESYSDAEWREREGPLGILGLSAALKVGLRAYERQLVAEARRQGSVQWPGGPGGWAQLTGGAFTAAC